MGIICVFFEVVFGVLVVNVYRNAPISFAIYVYTFSACISRTAEWIYMKCIRKFYESMY